MTGQARRRGRIALLASFVTLALVFLALGTWQVERRAWKLDLIARVEQRVHAAAVPAPRAAAGFEPSRDDYRRVSASGRYLDDRTALVQAVTEHGAGWWVLTPLMRSDDPVPLLVNRGFVPAEARGHVAPGGGPVTVTGLMRADEPGGGFLRKNDPAGDRWHSRDLQAIAATRGLPKVAPWFLDAQATGAASPVAVPAAASTPDASSSEPARAPGAVPSPPAAAYAPGTGDVAPLAGLTVVAFRNSHAVYALTWYTLAMMTALAAWRLRRETPGDDDDYR